MFSMFSMLSHPGLQDGTTFLFEEKSSGVPSGVCPDGFTPLEGSVALPRGGIKLPPDTKVVKFDF